MRSLDRGPTAGTACGVDRIVDPPDVLVLDEAHVGLAVLNSLKEEMKQLHTVLWADLMTVEFG